MVLCPAKKLVSTFNPTSLLGVPFQYPKVPKPISSKEPGLALGAQKVYRDNGSILKVSSNQV